MRALGRLGRSEKADLIMSHEPMWPESPHAGERAGAEERAAALALETKLGMPECLRRAGVGERAFLRFLAGVGNYRSTLTCIRAWLSREAGK